MGCCAPARSRTAWLELVLVGIRLTSYVVALLVLLPPTKAVAFFAVQMAVFGLCLGGSFAPSHKGMPIVPPTAKIDFFRRQVLMSRNVRGGLLVDFFMGGLNYQIEHHLFPEHGPAEPQAGAAADARVLRSSTTCPTPRSGCSSPTGSS